MRVDGENYPDGMSDAPAESAFLPELVEEAFHNLVSTLLEYATFPLRIVLRAEMPRQRSDDPNYEEGEKIGFLYDLSDLDTPWARLVYGVDLLVSIAVDRLRCVQVMAKSLLSLLCLIAHFVIIWLLSRSYQRLLLPAALVVIVVVGFLAAGMLRSPRDLVNHYHKAAADAIDRNDFSTAELCYRKLEQLKPSNNVSQFREAELLAKDGDWDGAYRLMQQLAAKRGLGYLPAHLWIAHALSSKRVSTDEESPQQLINFHLNRVLGHDPGNELANRLLADQQAAGGAASDAIETLENLPPRDAETEIDRNLQLAEIRWGSRETASAVQLWRDAACRLNELSKDGISLSPQSFGSWAYAHTRLGNPAEAIHVLQVGLERHPDNEELAAYYHRECEGFGKRRGLESLFLMEGHFQTIKRLFASRQNDDATIIQMVNAFAVPSVEREAKRLLADRLRKDDLPLAAYERLANIALSRGEDEEAARLYRRVLTDDSHRPDSLNNLAWILSQRESSNYDYALYLIERAISIDEQAVA